MSTRPTTPTSSELAEEATNWVVGGGIITMALFPLALPGLIILLIGAIPLLLLAVPLALVALPILLVRGIVRRLTRAPRTGGAPTSIHQVGHPNVG